MSLNTLRKTPTRYRRLLKRASANCLGCGAAVRSNVEDEINFHPMHCIAYDCGAYALIFASADYIVTKDCGQLANALWNAWGEIERGVAA